MPRLSLALCALSLFAQRPPGPPTFPPDDPEGLQVSPNPRIRHAWKRKVFWKNPTSAIGGSRGRIPAFTAAESQQMRQHLDALQALFQATPAGSSGEGYWVNAPRGFGYQDPFEVPARLPAAKLPLQYETGLFPFYHEDRETGGRWELSPPGETESVYFHFNQLPGALSGATLAEEPRGASESPHAPLPAASRHRPLPRPAVYEEQVLVVARPGPRPLGARHARPPAEGLAAACGKGSPDRGESSGGPEEQERHPSSARLGAAIPGAIRKNYGALRTARPQGYATRLASFERELAYTRERAAAEADPKRDATGAWYWNPVDAHAGLTRQLAALTPAEAARPACLAPFQDNNESQGRYSLPGHVRLAGASPDCREVVTLNYDYFDLTLPRTAPQLLTVRDFGRCAKLDARGEIIPRKVTRFDTPAHGCYRHLDMWRDLDWAAFAKLVVP